MANNNKQQMQYQLLSQNQLSQNDDFLFQIKKSVALFLIVSFLLYRLLFESSITEGVCLRDLTHILTQPLNAYIHSSPLFAQCLLTMSQLFIDLTLAFLCLLAINHYQSLQLHTWYVLFYGIRAAFIAIELFPIDLRTYWVQPRLPSVAVPYGLTRDFFYSGHTGFMFYALLQWIHFKRNKLVIFTAFGLFLVVLTLLTCRVHYFIDIVGAFVFGVLVNHHSQRFVICLDKIFSVFYPIGRWIARTFDFV